MSDDPSTIGRSMSEAQRMLQDAHATDTPALDIRLIFRKVLALTTEQLMCRLEDTLPPRSAERIDELIRRRMDREPMAYILGWKEFYGHTFLVDERVLIPRPDTETLVETAIFHIKGKQSFLRCGGGTWGDNLKIIDVCTGSGCVGISLAAEHPDCHVTLSDISADALAVAEENARRILGKDLEYIQGNLLSPFIPVPLDTQQDAYDRNLRQEFGDSAYGYEIFDPAPFTAETTRMFDVIVSNPPYLTEQWYEEVDAQVKWEPRLALTGGGIDGLRMIRELIDQASAVLTPGGALLLECDYRQCDAVSAIMKGNGFYDIRVERDLAGKPRVVWGIA
ncbi:MAG: peptide chain release factor N(5)-glutamine methyltransferase [Sphaerochaetaceae bacterium]|jgi:release factor glutamine methyltransferase